MCITPLLCGCEKTNKEKGSDAQRLHLLAERLHATLGEPNSAEYDEDKYIAELKHLLEEPELLQADSLRADYRLRMCLKNRPGTVAKDFNMELSDGTKLPLSKIDSEQLVVVFYDPDCGHCSAMVNELGDRLQAVNIDVLAVYTEGKEDVWRGSIAAMPKGWRVAIDRDSIVDRELYSIPAMPTIYLLDKEKKVVLKDPDINQLMRYLEGGVLL